MNGIIEGFWVVVDFTGNSRKTLHKEELGAVNQACYLSEKNPGKYYYVAQVQRCFVSPKGVQELDVVFEEGKNEKH